MKLRHGLGIFAILSLALVGCDGDQGPAGPPGPEGPQGPEGPPGTSFSEFAYQGNFGEACQHCHSGTVGDVLTTNHTNAFLDLGDMQDNLYCVQCHTTGFNCEVDHDTGEIIEGTCEEPSDGYSGYVDDDTELGAERRAALEGVQCEACHGAMGPNFNAHIPVVSFATHDDPATGESLSLCYDCHYFQVDEWKTSGHANAAGGDIAAFQEEHYVTSSSCQACHTSEGYARNNDPGLATYEFDEYSFIGCPTCHDPHVGEMGSGNEAQLRNVDPVVLAYTFPWEPDDPEAPTMEGYGPGQTCAQCHHGRRDNDNVQGQIDDGYGHFGPHLSPQADMFIGAGSYEIPGYDYSGARESTHNQLFEDGCVNCHMTFSESFGGHIVHNFMPDLEVCQPCHAGLDEAGLEALQQTYIDKLDEIAVLLGYTDWATLMLTVDDDNLTMTVCQREALYGAVFVQESGDFGPHNPNYANALLDNAIDYLTNTCVP